MEKDEIKEKRARKAKRAEEISGAHYKAGLLERAVRDITNEERYAGCTQEQVKTLQNYVGFGFEMLTRFADKESILRVTAALTTELSATAQKCYKIVDEGWV